MSIDVNEIIDLAKKAGKAILSVYDKDQGVEYKDDKSPLTKADIASNSVIIEGLAKYGLPILSEESKEIAFEERRKWKRFWLVDPLDGTKEFIKKNGEFTVNIALIEDGEPILGVVYLPVKNVIYYGVKGDGSYKIDSDGKVKINVKKRCGKTVIAASRSHMNEETERFVEEYRKKGDVDLISAGSSLKICLVAEGKADIYPRLGPTMEWDTAAGYAVVKFAGGSVKIYGREDELRYNKENLLNPYFIVE